jgi:uncharacterized membrane protein YdfJ with MMPL/SSD domain
VPAMATLVGSANWWPSRLSMQRPLTRSPDVSAE